jgi:hypothetical protein
VAALRRRSDRIAELIDGIPGRDGFELTEETQAELRQAVPLLQRAIGFLTPAFTREADQRTHAVLDICLGASIDEAPRQPIDEPDRSIGAHQRQRPGVRGDLPAIKRGHHSPSPHT